MLVESLTLAVDSIPSLGRSTDTLERRYTNEQSAFAQVEDMRVHYRVEGDPEGQTLLLLHGTYSSLHTWEGWVEQLRDRFHIVRLDMPGFGLTGPREHGDHTVRCLVDAVVGVSDHLGLDDVVVVGNSLGGGVGWRLAARRPDLVSGAILIDAGGGTLLCRIIDSLTSPLVAQYALSRAAVRLVINDAYASANSPSHSVVRRYHDLLLRSGNRPAVREIARTYRENHRDHCGSRSLLPSLPSMHEPYSGICDPYCISDIDAPVLFQWGAEDSWLPVRFGRELDERVDESDFIVYEDAGHVPMEERPVETAADARDFLDSL
jgi:pimeloyl-ACP methyl ester carboxylesterase